MEKKIFLTVSPPPLSEGLTVHRLQYFLVKVHSGDFRSWESPQTLPAHFIGNYEHVKRFPNLKFAVIRITDIQSTVLSASEGTAAIHLAVK